MVSISALLLVCASTVGATLVQKPSGFPPELVDLTWGGQSDNFPLPYNLSASLSPDKVPINGSFWAASFLSASNGHDYLAFGHVMKLPTGPNGSFTTSVYRSSIIDVHDPSYYANYAETTNLTELYNQAGSFEAVYDGFGMVSMNDTNPLDAMRVYSSAHGVNYDLKFKFSSPVLLNGGLGTFWVNGGLGYQWSMPRGQTSGWIKVNGTKLEVDPKKSSTWFDRQWGSVSLNFQWFMIIIPGNVGHGSDDLVLSIWDWKDPVNGNKTFATMREGVTGTKVMPASVWSSDNNTWTSPKTGSVYPQEWAIKLGNGMEFSVTSVRGDQVSHTPDGQGTAFSGYSKVIVKGFRELPVEGYALVDVSVPSF